MRKSALALRTLLASKTYNTGTSTNNEPANRKEEEEVIILAGRAVTCEQAPHIERDIAKAREVLDRLARKISMQKGKVVDC